MPKGEAQELGRAFGQIAIVVEERRQPYRITAEGMSVLRAKLTTLHRFARSGLKRLELL
jgi:predicted transcriptional regulator